MQRADLSKSQAKVSVQHTTDDRGVKITTFKLDPVLIENNEAGKAFVLLLASVIYEDKSPATKHVSLNFHARSRECRFSNKADLLLVLDDGTITLTNGPGKSGEGTLWVYSEPEDDLCIESCAAIISEQTFSRLIRSKNVEARLGEVTLRLGAIPLQALRELAAYVRTTKGAQ